MAWQIRWRSGLCVTAANIDSRIGRLKRRTAHDAIAPAALPTVA
jgi:hypothetical protein